MNRRKFLQNASLSALGGLALSQSMANSFFPIGEKPNSLISGVQIGVITYSFRSMPGTVDDIVKYCKESGISAIELMGDAVEEFAGAPKNPIDFRSLYVNGKRRELTGEEIQKRDQYVKDLAAWRSTVSMKPFKAVKKKFDSAGVSIYAFKPNAFGVNNTDAEIAYGMKAAKVLGAKSVTLELPKDAQQTARLGKLGEQHKMYVGYHAHTQATDTLWNEALAQSPYNSLNLDCGHYIAAGGTNTKESLLKLIEEKHDRITSMHIKDRQTKANGGGNLVWGKGNTPICEILELLRDKKYAIPATIELEYQVPESSDAVKEVKKCLAFAKACLA